MNADIVPVSQEIGEFFGEITGSRLRDVVLWVCGFDMYLEVLLRRRPVRGVCSDTTLSAIIHGFQCIRNLPNKKVRRSSSGNLVSGVWEV